MRIPSDPKTSLAARALRDLANSYDAKARHPDYADLVATLQADAHHLRSAAISWENASQRVAMDAIDRWDTLPREEAMIALYKAGVLTAQEARLTQAGIQAARRTPPA